VRNDHVEPVNRAALKDRDEQFSSRAGCRRGAAEKLWLKAERQHRHRAGLEEDSSAQHD